MSQAAEILKSKRAELCLTQKEFAQLLRLGEQGEHVLKRWEYGEEEPGDEYVKAALKIDATPPFAPKETEAARFTFADLFAGIGGMHLGCSSAGGVCVYASEHDKHCQVQYRQNFGFTPDGDITQVDEKTIPDHDVLIAGFPCQPFSIAGVSKKKSLGRETGFMDKAQGTLFFDVARIIREKRPHAFMLENVKNLKSHDKGNTWKVIEGTLKDLDYEVFSEVIDGKGLVPQHRERIFIIGFDKERYGEKIDFRFNIERPQNTPALKDILDIEGVERYTLSDSLWSYLQNYAKRQKAKGNGFGFGMPDLEGTARTLSARYYKDGSEILIRQDGKNPRKLTPRECARLQGYPEEYRIVVSDTQAYRQFGNSVVVPLVAQLANLVAIKLEELEGGSN